VGHVADRTLATPVRCQAGSGRRRQADLLEQNEGAAPRRCDAGGPLRDIEADGKAMTSTMATATKPRTAWKVLDDRCSRPRRRGIDDRPVIIVLSLEVAARAC